MTESRNRIFRTMIFSLQKICAHCAHKYKGRRIKEDLVIPHISINEVCRWHCSNRQTQNCCEKHYVMHDNNGHAPAK